MKRSVRRLVACMAMLGLLFAQLSLPAYACPFDAGAAQRAAMADKHAGCTGRDAVPVDGTLCELHCQDAASIPSSPAPPVALLPLQPLVVVERSDATVAIGVTGQRFTLATMATAPPVAIRYCRFLI